jgi:guanine nucleotide-binding protein subunit gamma
MPAMMAAAPYEIRTGGDGKSKKQSMAELKLRRLTELNQRLREDLERRRIPVSEAALEYACPPLIDRAARPQELTLHRSLIAFTDKEPKDWMVPSRWGTVRQFPMFINDVCNANPSARSTSARTPTHPSKVTAAAS